MAELNPPMWLEAESHPSDAMRRLVEWLNPAGVLSGFAVTEKAAPGMGVTVSTGAGMVAGDYVTVRQNDGTYKTTTIASVTDGVTIVLTAGLAVAASVGNEVRTTRFKAMANLAA